MFAAGSLEPVHCVVAVSLGVGLFEMTGISGLYTTALRRLEALVTPTLTAKLSQL